MGNAKDMAMDKRRAIQIITKAAAEYQRELEDQKLFFLYGTASEVRKHLQAGEVRLLSIKGYEVTFQRQNFQHLAGVRVNRGEIASAIHFYEKCLAKRLTEDDFNFAGDGSTVQKLDILENMMQIKHNAAMIGNFTDRGPKLYTEKVAGGVCGCIGFVNDRNTGMNVPNTLLKKDIRDITASPIQKIYAVFSKSYMAEKYSVLEKADKSIDIRKCLFSEIIEKRLDREVMREGRHMKYDI